MEENNRKGTGVFYAVVGVATLVVAIIGATFAYFSATAANDSTTDIKGNTAEAASLGLKVTKVLPTDVENEKIIPLASENNMSKALTANCLDAKGYTACQVYKIEVTSTTTENVSVIPKVTLTDTANVFNNLKFQLLSGTSSADFAIDSENMTAAVGDSSETALVARTANATTPSVWYFVVWLEEAGEANQTEAGKSFGGTVSASATDALGNPISGQLTATFS